MLQGDGHKDTRLFATILLATIVPWLFILLSIRVLIARHGKAPADLKRVQVLVLGDIGRSPRMQYHALSLAAHGMQVKVIGYRESPLHPDIVASPNIQVIPLQKTPTCLITSSRKLFVFLGPLKVLLQIWSLASVLLFRTPHCGWLLVQNPPSIPCLAVAQIVCLFRHTRLVIDWHNFGYSILALKLGDNHLLVRISKLYERLFSHNAYAHLCVTNAMVRALQRSLGHSKPMIPLHDRPAAVFQLFNEEQRAKFLDRLSRTSLRDENLDLVISRKRKLVVSSTSWTPDEDFSILLKALVKYSDPSTHPTQQPEILVIITGKGPLKTHFETQIHQLEKQGKLRLVTIRTLFFDDLSDYARLLGSADLGVSLHTSSSGVDLPMKVVDMFGTGLPVVGWDDYEAWPELVTEGSNGLGFRDVDGLEQALSELLGGDPALLRRLRRGAIEEGKRRWDEEWKARAPAIFGIKA